jgi:membrane associated rhomboid family serine protease
MRDYQHEDSQGAYPATGPEGSLSWVDLRGSVSFWVAAICTTLFVAVWAVSLFRLASHEQVVTFLGLSYPGIVQRHWLHQFLTAPFLHQGISHLLFNMLSLWLLGPSVEAAMGRLKYLLFSAVCGVSSMAGFLLVNWGTGGICLGYSGVIFGILVAQAMFFPDRRFLVLFVFPMKMKHAVLLFAAVEFFLTTAPESGGVANSAHLFGAVAAFACLKTGRLWRGIQVRAQAARSRVKRRAHHRNARRDVPREL